MNNNTDNNNAASAAANIAQRNGASFGKVRLSARKATIATHVIPDADPTHEINNTTANDKNTNDVPSLVEMIDLTSSPEGESESEPSFATAADRTLDEMNDVDEKTSLDEKEPPQPVLKDYSSRNAQQIEQTSEGEHQQEEQQQHEHQQPQQTTEATELNEQPATDETPRLGSYKNPIIVRLASAVHNNEPHFKFGPYIPFTRHGNEILIHPNNMVQEYVDTDEHELAKKLNREMLPEDSVIEVPSLVTPFLLKKRTKWPSRAPAANANNQSKNDVTTSSNGCDTSASNSHSQRVQKAIEFDQRNNDFIYCNQIVGGNYKQIEVVKLIYRKESDDLLSLPNETPISGTTSPLNDNGGNSNMRSVRDYVREAAVLGLTKEHQVRCGKALAIHDFGQTRVSEMLLNIGLNQVKEFTLGQDVKKLNWEVRHNADKCIEHIQDLDNMKQVLDRLKAFNKPYKSTTSYPCDQCDFKAHTMVSYLAHKEVPHIKNRNYCCNWCQFKTRDQDALTFHTMVSHKKRCRFEIPHKPLKCDHCSFETNHKKRAQNHIESCRRSFNQDLYLGPQLYEHEFPPAVTAKPISREDVICYDRMLKEVRLSGRKPSAIRVDNSSVASAQFNQNNNINKRRSNSHTGVNTTSASSILEDVAMSNGHNNNCNMNHVQHTRQPNFTYAKRTYSSLGGDTTNHGVHNNNSNNSADHGHMSCDNTPIGPKRMRYGSVRSGSESPNFDKDLSTFVICEICDSYISDLQQLRIHMQLIHKIKLHSKILESRPPLTCGRCGWRFFTDQGLERHLLGLHGLVTTNLQDQVDQETDAGRCTKCGRAFGNKLVVHMKDVHKLVLKSACLAYKCIMCGAVFNLYRLFENHVYAVHGDAIKGTRTTTTRLSTN